MEAVHRLDPPSARRTTVDLTITSNIDAIDAKLRAGTADARADGGVGPNFQARILTHPSLKAHADNPVLAALRYIAVIPSVVPNVHCRRAIFYAFDKRAGLRSFGGPTGGRVAHSMTPPGIPGYQAGYNPYPSGSSGDRPAGQGAARAAAVRQTARVLRQVRLPGAELGSAVPRRTPRSTPCTASASR